MGMRKDIIMTKEEIANQKRFYNIRSIMGYDDIVFRILIGSRACGKSYAVMEQFIRDWKRYGTVFTWIRISETSVKKMLSGKTCNKFVDAALVRKYDLDLTHKGMDVYNHGKPFARCLALSQMSKEKGVALFDHEYDGIYNICFDEFMTEKGEKRIVKDLVYNLTGTLENLLRTRKDKIRIFMCANNLQEASEILVNGFNFIPEEFGRFILRNKRAIIDYITPSDAYLKDRKGSVADLLSPEASNFTNKLQMDRQLLYKGRLEKPIAIIKFSKDKRDWYTIWNERVIVPYNQEKVRVMAMRPYIDEIFDDSLRDSIIARYDNRGFLFKNLITQKAFEHQLEILKPRGN